MPPSTRLGVTARGWSGAAAGVPAAVVLGLLVLPALLLAAPFLAAGAWLDRRRRRRLQRESHARWGAEGKRLLLVYSDSPNWREYIERHWLPPLAPVAVVLNWSERLTWTERHPLEAAIFRAWAGEREFNPIAIVIPPEGAVRVIRFWRAFRNYKHGRPRALRGCEAELEAAVGIPLPAAADQGPAGPKSP